MFSTVDLGEDTGIIMHQDSVEIVMRGGSFSPSVMGHAAPRGVDHAAFYSGCAAKIST